MEKPRQLIGYAAKALGFQSYHPFKRLLLRFANLQPRGHFTCSGRGAFRGGKSIFFTRAKFFFLRAPAASQEASARRGRHPPTPPSRATGRAGKKLGLFPTFFQRETAAATTSRSGLPAPPFRQNPLHAAEAAGGSQRAPAPLLALPPSLPRRACPFRDPPQPRRAAERRGEARRGEEGISGRRRRQ